MAGVLPAVITAVMRAAWIVQAHKATHRRKSRNTIMLWCRPALHVFRVETFLLLAICGFLPIDSRPEMQIIRKPDNLPRGGGVFGANNN